MKVVIILIFVVLALTAGVLLYTSGQDTPAQSLNGGTENPKTPISSPGNSNYTAKFAIFTNGTFRIFTDAMYHNRSSEVYLLADNPNLVRVKKSGIHWRDFFASLPFALSETCLTTGTGQTFCTNKENTLKFFLNGVRMDDALSHAISENDQLLVTYGPEDDPQIPQQLQRLGEL